MDSRRELEIREIVLNLTTKVRVYVVMLWCFLLFLQFFKIMYCYYTAPDFYRILRDWDTTRSCYVTHLQQHSREPTDFDKSSWKSITSIKRQKTERINYMQWSSKKFKVCYIFFHTVTKKNLKCNTQKHIDNFHP